MPSNWPCPFFCRKLSTSVLTCSKVSRLIGSIGVAGAVDVARRCLNGSLIITCRSGRWVRFHHQYLTSRCSFHHVDLSAQRTFVSLPLRPTSHQCSRYRIPGFMPALLQGAAVLRRAP